MGKKYDFEYIVIGSGPAGSTVALELARARKKVALVEGDAFGGANLNTRDIPSLVAFDFSHTLSQVLNFPELQNQEFSFNLPSLPARQLKTIIECGGDSKKPFEDAGITCIDGFANFLDPHTIAVNEKRFTADTFILATGSKIKTTEVSNINFVEYLTPEAALKLNKLPQVAAVIGAGPTGVEIAEYYAELGIKVILFEAADYLLPREDREVGDRISDYFTERLGITVLPGCKVVAVEQDEFSKRVVFRYMNTEKVVRVDCVVLATGSTPVLDYGLENAKVKYTPNGILVDKLFQTSSKNIYAIGDALGKESSTDRSINEALCLASNLINKTKNVFNYRGLVRSIKTYPEVATVGYTENDLLSRERKYQKAFVKLSDIIASQIYDFDYGFIKLISDRNNHILGATVVAPHAELIISELALAVRHNLTAIELASTPHTTNSYNFLIKYAARELVKRQKLKIKSDKTKPTKVIKLKQPKLKKAKAPKAPKTPKPTKAPVTLKKIKK